jgi:anti-sigma B factor antagonist
MEGIDIHEYKVGALQDITLLKTFGIIDTNTSAELQKVINQTIENGNCQLIIDMGAVQYVSSAGWGVFVGEIRRLKEKGGDLKISQMSPEVNEVFEMLEFHQILASYDRLEEAIEDFDFYRDLNSLPSNGKVLGFSSDFEKNQNRMTPVNNPVAMEAGPIEPIRRSDQILHAVNRASAGVEVDEKKLPMNEKIKRIVLENPLMGIWGIQKMLFSPRFGYTKLSLLNLHSLLKKLNLQTKAKRFRYYRSR